MRVSIWALLGCTPQVLAANCWRNTKCAGPSTAAFPGPWDANNYAPTSRTVSPKSILSLPAGDFISTFEETDNIILGPDTTDLVFDFGKEVGGIITVKYTLTGAPATLGLAFTESKKFIGRESDSSNGGTTADGALTANLTTEGAGTYVVPDQKLRGGFRYLTLFLESDSQSTLSIDGIELEISFQPTWSNLRAYQGYFHSSDELLNKIWYAGAYTLQTNSVPGHTGRRDVDLSRGSWFNDAFIGPGDTVLLDGAKRDRWVWIGDMGTAVPPAFVSTGDLESTKNALRAIWENQTPSGILPKAGPPYLSSNSDTYHLWAIVGLYNYYLYTEDSAFVESLWPSYLRAIDYTSAKVLSTGVFNATQTGDWGRLKNGTVAAAANVMFYRALRTGSLLAAWTGKKEDAKRFDKKATALQKAIIEQFWDEKKGALKDSPDNNKLYPQDGNSMALAYDLFPPTSKEASRISDYLESNWTPIGAHVPELPNNVSPFISSIELEGHFRIGRPDRALELIRTAWGWYHNNPNGTESTVIEGYLIDGTFGYRGPSYRNDESYISHAHGWSAGPTSTLTEYMVGLLVTKPRGAEWRLAPAAFNDLTEAEAGFTTGLGKFWAKFTVKGKKAVVEWSTPKGTKGELLIPGQKPKRVKGGKGKTTVRFGPWLYLVSEVFFDVMKRLQMKVTRGRASREEMRSFSISLLVLLLISESYNTHILTTAQQYINMIGQGDGNEPMKPTDQFHAILAYLYEFIFAHGEQKWHSSLWARYWLKRYFGSNGLEYFLVRAIVVASMTSVHCDPNVRLSIKHKTHQDFGTLSGERMNETDPETIEVAELRESCIKTDAMREFVTKLSLVFNAFGKRYDGGKTLGVLNMRLRSWFLMKVLLLQPPHNIGTPLRERLLLPLSASIIQKIRRN
ncbi:hypothetical protein HJFPF1_13267 [Paramyrothecium foliicola]|nr:hypothetical protein HJFPF1_13267 [Paramyrothecium foliicola]